MGLDTTRLTLFGLDLSQAGTYIRSGLRQALQWPALAWLTPSQPVNVFESDGRMRLVCAHTGQAVSGSTAPRFQALALDEAHVLSRTLWLPDLSDAQLAAALALEVAHASPFGEEGTVWGWRVRHSDEHEERINVELAMVQAAHVKALLERQPNSASQAFEVWVTHHNTPPIIMRGFAEPLRLAALRTQRTRRLLAVAGLGALLLALAVSPFLAQRAHVFQAQAALTELQAQSNHAVHAREALQKARDQAAVVQRLLQERPDLPGLLETLSRVLPDHTHIIRLDVQGTFVRLTGQGNEASLLVEQLSAHPSFRQLRSPSPIVRVGNTGAERFSLEFHYVPVKEEAS